MLTLKDVIPISEIDLAAKDNAFRLLRATLQGISDNFNGWARTFNQADPMGRMASSIASVIDQHTNMFTGLVLEHLTQVSPDKFVNLERYLDQSYKKLDLSSANTLQDLTRVLHWMEEVYFMELDPAHYIPELSNDPTYGKKFSNLRRDFIDLQYALKKEEQQLALDRQAAAAIDKLNSINLDPDEISSLRNRLESQATDLSSWTVRAENLARDLEGTKSTISQLESQALDAVNNFSAAQARYDAVSKRSSADTLVQHFQSFRKKHDVSTMFFFTIGIMVLFGVADFSVTFALQSGDAEFNLPELSWRFAIVAGGGAIGTYLLRLATYHRRLAVWADTMQVQLQTFASYTEQIGDEASKNQLRAEFAKRVFGEEPGRPQSGSGEKIESISIADLSTLIANIARIQVK
ncbi:hypothetical protein ACIOTN_16970 [Glutamicibacter sp. NPDC087661]|uniref:hypothetical protein n=1 Tax=Glutamicibacter sp. NPDC087661 TaxID=3363996 RepID=UPI0038250DBF